jgi:dihydrofolate reductase
MGSNTYNTNPVKVVSNQLIVVMTSQPSKYESIPGRLEFSDLSPLQLTRRFESEGYTQMVVVGGAHLATSFLKEQLIDEIWLTIEPKIFGAGVHIVVDEKLEIDLRLLSFEKVNDKGTLITKYAVKKSY